MKAKTPAHLFAKFFARALQIFLWLALLAFSIFPSDAAPQRRKRLENSVRELHGKRVQKIEALKAEHLRETVEFHVALQMRDFPKLLVRVQAGEKISRAEMEEK